MSEQQEIPQSELRAGMRVEKYDSVLGWVPGTMRKTSYMGKESISFVADGGQYAPSPTWPDSRFRPLTEQESKAETYNRDMDERNRISYEHREKPWLPLHDGE